MNEVLPFWNEDRLIESFDVDAKGRLRTQALFAFLTNVAWKHTSLTDHGYATLSARNQMWVLTKVQMVIARVPRWGDTIHVESWAKGVEKLYAMRDWAIRAADGSGLAAATSAWVILDQSTRRPLRVEQITFPWVPDRHVLQTDVKKVEALSRGRPAGRFRAAYSDLDPNGHVTAARFLAWMTDSHPADMLDANVPTSVDISFLGEGARDDEVLVTIEERGGFELCSVTREADGKELCRARIAWGPDQPRSGDAASG